MLASGTLGRFVADLGAYTVRSGRWWVPLVVVLLLAAAVMSTAQVVVPVATYTLF